MNLETACSISKGDGGLKVAIYCRLSEEDRNKQTETDDSGSIQNQKAMLMQYAIEQGWELFRIYSDDDYAGADRRRPEFNRLLQDAEARKFDIVLCKTQSRFTRELELVEKYIHGLFPIWGIRFISIVDNADTANKGNKKFYIQSVLSLEPEEKSRQERRPLSRIDDSFKKIIVTKDRVKASLDESGFLICNVKDFLLDRNLLDGADYPS
mgnify:CR=1 FL=1